MTATKEQWDLHDIVKCHDVARFRQFLTDHPTPAITAEQLANDQYLFDLLHITKAVMPMHYADQHAESLKYCLEKGLVEKNEQR